MLFTLKTPNYTASIYICTSQDQVIEAFVKVFMKPTIIAMEPFKENLLILVVDEDNGDG